ncbi:transcriptional regulator, AraC family [Malonomonas rubra DSM 5091]|uniref:Transcriptional regulator, AraC family n=1 Tax=Malonomonas rubra DSM 5091 TaxID=1122189 RepID=A0A1M6ITG4_MALRU|nr:AraC family transcriptional regulator [Malonomonas rubra]SHJ37694.1 transcriptional regulator, AraC family [Malonomonas rubra DSM 5091]
MSELGKLLQQLTPRDGFTETRLAGVRLFKASRPIPRCPLIYDPGICIVVSGKKIGYLGGKSFPYNADNYLVTSVTMPFECETQASPENPVLGIYIDIDLPLLHELIAQLGQDHEVTVRSDNVLPRAIGPALLEPEMSAAVGRLLKALQSETEAKILGPGLRKEILFRALQGQQSPVLYALASHSGNFARVARALQLIQKDFAENLDVDRLAQQAHMSPSAFHRAFKEVTSDSPLQYLKKIRLSKARDFIVQDGLKAYVAADRVGYESPSQFSREFKRYFGQSPAEMMRELRIA